VDVVGVVGEQREPGVVGLRDGPPVRVVIDVADGEVLEVAALPAGVRSSADPPVTAISCSRLGQLAG
jgi:hypothetical protein